MYRNTNTGYVHNFKIFHHKFRLSENQWLYKNMFTLTPFNAFLSMIFSTDCVACTLLSFGYAGAGCFSNML